MHPLDGPLLKIGRAEREIQALFDIESDFIKWAEENIDIVAAELNRKTGKDVLRLRTNAYPSLEWGVDIGEIAHNLRSALDGLVWQLARLNCDAPAGNTQFPIFLRGTTTRRRPRKPGKGKPSFIPHFAETGRNVLASLKSIHKTHIERLQPYKRGQGGRNGPLWRLSEVNNADKHRLIQVAGIARLATGFVLRNDAPPNAVTIGRLVVLKDGAKVGEVTHSMYVRSHTVAQIVFAKGCPSVQRLPVVSTLRGICEHVRHIVESFAREFTF